MARHLSTAAFLSSAIIIVTLFLTGTTASPAPNPIPRRMKNTATLLADNYDVGPNHGKPDNLTDPKCTSNGGPTANIGAVTQAQSAIAKLKGQKCGDTSNGRCTRMWSPSQKPSNSWGGAVVYICGPNVQLDCGDVADKLTKIIQTCVPDLGLQSPLGGGTIALTADINNFVGIWGDVDPPNPPTMQIP